MNYQVLNDQRKVLIDTHPRVTVTELTALMEEIKTSYPNLCQTVKVKSGDLVSIELIKLCGFKQGDRLSDDIFEWVLPEFDEGCYGLNGCGG